jgi:cytoskeletal protein CcmA (bactofilin family)
MADKQQTVIGPETRIVGEVRGEEDVLVQGRVEGRMALTSTLTIEDGAIVQADVEAQIVLISGVVVGNVTATESVRLTDKARVVGDLTSPRVVIEAGAAYRGHLEMGNVEGGVRRESAARRTAEPAKAPPRISVPSRVAAAPGAVAARVATASPPRAAPAPARTPPSLPRAEAAAAGGVASAPHPWAKKKLHRRG